MKHSPRPFLALDAAAIGALLAISALVYFVAVRPAFQRTEELKAAFNSIGDREREAADAEAARLDAERQSEKLARELQGAVKLLPASRLNERLAALAQAAKAHNVIVSQLTPGSPAIGAKFLTVPVKLAGSCSYTDLTRLLRDVHAQMPDTSIASITLSVDPASKGTTSAYSVDFVWYAAPAVSAAVESTP